MGISVVVFSLVGGGLCCLDAVVSAACYIEQASHGEAMHENAASCCRHYSSINRRLLTCVADYTVVTAAAAAAACCGTSGAWPLLALRCLSDR